MVGRNAIDVEQACSTHGPLETLADCAVWPVATNVNCGCVVKL